MILAGQFSDWWAYLAARAGSTSGGGGTSRARRITGGVTADSGVASRRADGLWTVRGRHRFDLPWCG
jgi:hypothetical protein